MNRIGIIGGTGLIKMEFGQHLTSAKLDLVRKDDVIVETKFGQVPLTCLKINGGGIEKELIFLQRHHNNGDANKPPHKINHRANISALRESGCEVIVSVCSIGSIAQDLPPGKVALASQYIDFTGVASSFHDDSAIFTSVTEPFSTKLNEILESVLRKSQNFSGDENMYYTYWLTQGPHFETSAEVDAIDRLGGHMVGMTMPREVKLTNELGLPYSAICISSNWAAGREPGEPGADLHHESVSSQANKRLNPVWDCIIALLTQ
tara:strand:- start:1067 stop:1855 length:789 start_codon:yes stop_codon:yes gene_type:complete